MFTKSIFKGIVTCLALATISSCGQSRSQSASSVLSTDERPDISDDRTSVHITAGTKDYAKIKASSLSALVSGVPDPHTAAVSTVVLKGQYIFRVAQNPRTNMVAIAVRGMLFTETDFSMLFVVNPKFPDKPQLVKFVMPGKKAASDGSTAAFRTVRGLSYDDAGILHLVHGDASGSTAEITVNPDLSLRSCEYLVKDEGSLCGETP